MAQSKRRRIDDDSEEEGPAKIKLGDVGYIFRKEFTSGWFTGVVCEIIDNPEDAGFDRRCVYEDDDAEDLRLEDLIQLQKLDPMINKRSSAPATPNGRLVTNKQQISSEGIFDLESSSATSTPEELIHRSKKDGKAGGGNAPLPLRKLPWLH